MEQMPMADMQKKYELLANELAAQPNIARAKMFGMPVVRVNGNAFMGYFKDSMTFKLTGKSHAAALKLSGAHLFDPSGMGRPMKEWVEVPGAHAARWKKLAQAALEYVSSLPAK
jgi:hypothetical protein